ncbi:hypothetical protein SESBI_01673 [Sesbania bispinosa]|nr:hypothetical protein SESBI_01673 [Sesbania bispinosa]
MCSAGTTRFRLKLNLRYNTKGRRLRGRGFRRREEMTQDKGSDLYDFEFEVDASELNQILYNEFLWQVHEKVDVVENVKDLERQNLQQAAFLRHLRHDVLPTYGRNFGFGESHC